MSPTYENRYLLLLAVAVAVVGTVDAAAGREWDLLAVFGLLDCILFTLVVRTHSRRRAVPLRSDLVVWLGRRAATTGEPFESVADRAVASYRDRLDPVAEGRSSSPA